MTKLVQFVLLNVGSPGTRYFKHVVTDDGNTVITLTENIKEAVHYIGLVHAEALVKHLTGYAEFKITPIEV